MSPMTPSIFIAPSVKVNFMLWRSPPTSLQRKMHACFWFLFYKNLQIWSLHFHQPGVVALLGEGDELRDGDRVLLPHTQLQDWQHFKLLSLRQYSQVSPCKPWSGSTAAGPCRPSPSRTRSPSPSWWSSWWRWGPGTSWCPPPAVLSSCQSWAYSCWVDNRASNEDSLPIDFKHASRLSFPVIRYFPSNLPIIAAWQCPSFPATNYGASFHPCLPPWAVTRVRSLWCEYRGQRVHEYK